MAVAWRSFGLAIVVATSLAPAGSSVAAPAIAGAGIAAATFPLSQPSLDSPALQLAPDGTLYVSQYAFVGGRWIAALDSKGAPKPGWPVEISPGSTPVLAADGTVLVMSCVPHRGGVCELHALTPTGTERAGSPVALPGGSFCSPPLLGPRGDVFVACNHGDTGTRAWRISLGGRVQAGWPVDLAGLSRAQGLVGDTFNTIQAQSAGLRDVAIAPDGLVRRGPVVVELGNDPAARGYAIAPDGTALTWGVTVAGEFLSDSTLVSAKLVAFGLVGVLSGWPHVSGEPISAPVFGPDSTIYFAHGQGTANGRIVALDRHAHPRSRWPVKLSIPAVTGHVGEGGATWPDVPSPIVGPDGRILLASIAHGTTVISLSANGISPPGWPYRSTRGLASACSNLLGETGCGSPVLSPVVASSGIAYVPLAGTTTGGGGGQIVALNPNGQVRAGWPFGVSSSSEVTSLLPGAGGKLYVAEMTGGSAPFASVVAVDSAGRRLYQTTVAVLGPSASTVTLADDRSTITMRVGDRFLLDLGLGFDWSITVADPSIVSRVLNIAVPVGAQGVYEAHAAGTTKLSAVGDPPCRQAVPPCAAPSRLFEATIVVQ
jgi:hypothetical protein